MGFFFFLFSFLSLFATIYRVGWNVDRPLKLAKLISGRLHLNFRETASEFQGEKAHFRKSQSKPDFFSTILNYLLQGTNEIIYLHDVVCSIMTQ